jgi:hypothetical protein
VLATFACGHGARLFRGNARGRRTSGTNGSGPGGAVRLRSAVRHRRAGLFVRERDLRPRPPRRGDCLEWHGRRDWPKVFLSGGDGLWYGGHGVHASGERCADPEPIVTTSRLALPSRCSRCGGPPLRISPEPLALSGLAYGTGATFHSDAGTRSELLGPVQLCAEAFFGEFLDR